MGLSCLLSTASTTQRSLCHNVLIYQYLQQITHLASIVQSTSFMITVVFFHTWSLYWLYDSHHTHGWLSLTLTVYLIAFNLSDFEAFVIYLVSAIACSNFHYLAILLIHYNRTACTMAWLVMNLSLDPNWHSSCEHLLTLTLNFCSKATDCKWAGLLCPVHSFAFLDW